MANNDEAGSSSRRITGHTIGTEDAWDLYRYGLLVPPDHRLPKGWAISYNGGLPVPPLPQTADQIRRAIARRRSWLSPAQRRSPEYDDNDWPRWLSRFERERNEGVAFFDGDVAPGSWNAEGRRRWWGRTGHTVASAIAAARQHAATGNPTPLRLLPVPPLALPRRVAPRRDEQASPRRSMLRPVKKEEPQSPPRRGGGGIVIRERRQERRSPPRGRLYLRRPKPEPEPRPVEVIPYGYDVPEVLRNEHDGDSPGLLAALADSVATIERDVPGLMATLADTAIAAASSSGGGASSSRAPPQERPSTSRAASSSTVVLIDDDDDDDGQEVDWNKLMEDTDEED